MSSECYICNGMEYPYNPKQEKLIEFSSDMLFHIVHYHLPLKCNKCSMIFETLDDFKMIGKCCKGEPTKKILSKENMGDIINVPSVMINGDDEKNMTPLTKINQRWRRKSREFGKVPEEPKQGAAVTRQTSTPFQLSLLSPLEMQMSSIKYSSNASESDFNSPPIVESVTKSVKPKSVVASPKDKKIPKTRAKIPTNNTPLRHAVSQLNSF